MKYKQINITREFEFSNGMIGRIDDKDISIFDEDGECVMTWTIKEAKQIYEVLGELLKEVKCEK